MRRLLACAFAAGSMLCAMPAFAQDAPDAMQWLEHIYKAGERLSYSGVFLYQSGDRIETSRIVRLVDTTGVHERVEALDGMPREIVRDNEEVTCYLPRTKTVKIDNRRQTRPFPIVQGDRLKDIGEHYRLLKGELMRVAGREAQMIVLQPRDHLRYEHELWADVDTGLLLKAKTFNERREQVEQFAFTQVVIGGDIDREQVQSQFAKAGGTWRIERSAMIEADLGKSGWTLTSLPAGYRKVTELRRRIGDSADVGHMVVSDGLAAVSVFIEPIGARIARAVIGQSRQGALNIYTRNIDGHLVTVMGEVPADSVRQIADGVVHHRGATH